MHCAAPLRVRVRVRLRAFFLPERQKDTLAVFAG